MHCVNDESELLQTVRSLAWTLKFNYSTVPIRSIPIESLPIVAIIREEGSNGDREMAAAFNLAGFRVWDITMTDIVCTRRIDDLDRFVGIAFVGGFSYGDVLGSAKGQQYLK